jgi:hypothetical protein
VIILNKSKRNLLIFVVGTSLAFGLAGIAYAAFGDKGEIKGTTFMVGSNDIKLLRSMIQGTEPENLADQLNGPLFRNVGQYWQQDYNMKILNNGSLESNITSHANYETINDPDELRQYVYAEIFPWHDDNEDGSNTPNELGASLGKKTLIKWKTEGISLGSLAPNALMGLAIRFSTESIPDSKQGKQGVFSFEFESVEKQTGTQ